MLIMFPSLSLFLKLEKQLALEVTKKLVDYIKKCPGCEVGENLTEEEEKDSKLSTVLFKVGYNQYLILAGGFKKICSIVDQSDNSSSTCGMFTLKPKKSKPRIRYGEACYIKLEEVWSLVRYRGKVNGKDPTSESKFSFIAIGEEDLKNGLVYTPAQTDDSVAEDESLIYITSLDEQGGLIKRANKK